MRIQSIASSLIAILISVMLVTQLAPEAHADAESDFLYATSLFRKQRWKYAAEAFEEFLKQHENHPRVPLAHLYLGLSLNSLEKYGPAREHFLQYIKVSPNGRNAADARYRIGECSYYLKEYDAAISQLSEYLKRHPGHALNGWAGLLLAESHLALKQYDQAEKVLAALLKQNPPDDILPDTLFAYGMALQGQKKNAAALQQFKRVADMQSPRVSHRALARTGTIHFEAGNFQLAAAEWDRLAEEYSAHPVAPSAILRSGIAWFQAKDYKQALARFNSVPEAAPVHPQALMWAGLCYRELQQFDQAREALQKALAAAKDDALAAEITFHRAQVELLANNKAQAAQLFADLAARWPADSHACKALFNAAELKMETGDTDQAEAILRQLQNEYENCTDEAQLNLLKGRLLLHKGETLEAIQTLRQTELPESAPIRLRILRSYHLIRALHRAKEYADAVAEFEKIQPLLRQPGFDEFTGAFALAAVCSLELKDYEKSRRYADEFLALEKDSRRHADALATRAVACSQLRDYATAKQDLESLKNQYADNESTWIAILQSAEAAWSHNDFENAAEFFELAADRRDNPEQQIAALTGAAWSRYRLKQYEAAAAAFQKAYTLYPDSPDAVEARYMEATCLLDLKQMQPAAAAFLKLYDQLDSSADPKATEQRYFLDAGRMYARIMEQVGNIDQADKMWERIASRFDDSEQLDEILDEWAYINLQHQRYDRADEIYTQLLDRFPESRFAGHARLSLAESLMQANQLDAALREFVAISQHENYGAAEKEAALYHAIDIYAARREWPDVLRLAEQFLSTFPTSDLAPNIRLLQAEGLLDAGRADEAERLLNDLRKAVLEGKVGQQKWTDRVWVALAEVALMRKQYAQIDSLYQELLTRSPQSEFLFQMWDVQGRRWKTQPEPDFSKSREYFAKVVQSQVAKGTETAARCQFQIAETYLLEKNYQAARKEYYRVYLNYAWDEWRAMALFQAAGCELKLNDKEAAVRSYKDLIKDFPNSALAARAKEQLKALEKTPGDSSPQS